jgi:hypothetical protein
MDADQDMSDDQQDIQRGRQMVDSLFQGGQGMGGTHNAILSSADYLSTVRRPLPPPRSCPFTPADSTCCSP